MRNQSLLILDAPSASTTGKWQIFKKRLVRHDDADVAEYLYATEED